MWERGWAGGSLKDDLSFSPNGWSLGHSSCGHNVGTAPGGQPAKDADLCFLGPAGGQEEGNVTQDSATCTLKPPPQSAQVCDCFLGLTGASPLVTGGRLSLLTFTGGISAHRGLCVSAHGQHSKSQGEHRAPGTESAAEGDSCG